MAIFKSCYNCKDRKVGCHSICEKYKMEAEQNKQLKNLIKKEKNLLKQVIKY